MTVKGGPKIETDGLVFHLDAAAASIGKGYPIDGLDVEYLIVAGGGGGGGVIGGGGGAGGLLYGSTKATIATGTYAVVVGAGGSGGTGWNTSGQDGKVGGDSSVFSVTSSGGGGGRHYGGSTSSTTVNGGSGGGGANGGSGGGTGINGQGNNGGGSGSNNVGAGGGGAGTSGGNANHSLNLGGHGGLDKYFGDRFGSVGYDGWFADGGGGGVRADRTRGLGSNGAGDGGNYNGDTPSLTNAVINTGSGGGGAGYSAVSNSIVGGNGGSGVVLIRYKGSQKASGGDSIIKHRGYTVHVFTSSGSFVVGDRVGGTSRNKIVGTLTNMDSSNYTNDKTFAFNLDGTDEKIVIPNFRRFTASESMTIESYVRLSTLNSYSTILQRGYSTGSYPKYYLRRANTQGWSFVVGDASGNVIGVTHSTIPSVGVWYYIVGTLDRDTDLVSLYVNGSLIGSNDCSSLGSIDNAAGELTIGDYITNATYAVFQGSIAKVSIYNTALSQQQILDNYNATKGRFGL